MARPPFPTVIDSSAMAAFRSCPRKFELEYLHHYKGMDESVHLHAGKAFARGLEVAREAFYVEGLSHDDAIARGIGALLEAYGSFECPDDSAKSALRMAGALEYYFGAWPMTSESAAPTILASGQRAIEFSFLEPLEFDHPQTGEPLLYSGRFDMICDYAGGLFGEDDKTTKQLGASWPNQWALRSQFTAYCWGAKQGGLPLQGMLVRGVSILKTKYDHLQAVTYRPQWMLDRWYEQTLRDLTRMRAMWEAEAFDYNLEESCNSYGGCMFKRVCESENPEPWLASGYQRRRWDPVLRVEEVLED